jgi:hypothetical protein
MQVIHSGGGAPLHRGMSAKGRMQGAPASPPEADALQHSPSQPAAAAAGATARRQQQRSLSGPVGGGLAAVAAAAAVAATPGLTPPAGVIRHTRCSCFCRSSSCTSHTCQAEQV